MKLASPADQDARRRSGHDSGDELEPMSGTSMNLLRERSRDQSHSQQSHSQQSHPQQSHRRGTTPPRAAGLEHSHCRDLHQRLEPMVALHRDGYSVLPLKVMTGRRNKGRETMPRKWGIVPDSQTRYQWWNATADDDDRQSSPMTPERRKGAGRW